MTNYRKKLIEVALPLTEINDASAYDKMPGIGPHPKGIHHWWARLPLPVARAVLFASLVDDPSSDPRFSDKSPEVQEEERRRLFAVLTDLLQKKIHEHPAVFETAHKEIVRCCGKKLPTVIDPFCGGGSVPLEAQRLGLHAEGSDLNPVAVLITKAAVEIVPKYLNHPPVNPRARREMLKSADWCGAKGLANDVRYYADVVYKAACGSLRTLYPNVAISKEHGGGDATVVAWIWTRTVKCPNPGCGAMMPLVRSFRLATKDKRRAWVEPVIDKSATPPTINYAIRTGKGSPPERTVTRRGAKCLACQEPVTFDYISSEGRAGRIVPQLMAIVAEGTRSRVYLPPNPEHERLARKAKPSAYPDTDLPEKALGFRVQRYGMTKHADLFTSRQLVALTTLSDEIRKVHAEIQTDAKSLADPKDYADAVCTFIGFALDRCADFGNALCRWTAGNEKVMNLFGRSAIPMTWDFAEANTLAEVVGGWPTCSKYVANCIEVIPVCTAVAPAGVATQLDAVVAGHDKSGILVSTDPPYYDNIGYSDLSDCFYIWLRRTIGSFYPMVCSTVLVPKGPELIASPDRFGGNAIAAKNHFESGFRKVFTSVKAKLDDQFPMTVYYAFKQSDEEEGGDDDDEEGSGAITLTTGWETMLEGLNSSGFQVTGTWPVRASQAWRMRAMGSNALASYIVLACRPRSTSAPLATRKEFIAFLRRELPAALRNLQKGNIAPVDLAQASIGPGMAVFSRYAKVMETDGSPMSVRTALGLINQALDEVLAEQEGEFDAETRFALAWFEQFGMEEGPFGDADVLARAKDTAVNGLVEAGVIKASRGKVQLLKRSELPDDWNPATDKRLTIWEVTQHLIRTVETKGESAAAALLHQLGGMGEIARDLAYRLYTICERKKWAEEAMAYNGLVIAWSELSKLALSERPKPTATQTKLFQ
jgi:putative DNA methylase